MVIWYLHVIISDVFKFSCIHILALQGQCLDLLILILTDNGLVSFVSLSPNYPKDWDTLRNCCNYKSCLNLICNSQFFTIL